MKIIDLRSDTVTQPTPRMREVIASAEVGDDVFGDDPTVNRLQDKVAELLGKEAALFVPSGTMANQVSIKTHTQPGDEVILEANSHVFNYESGAPALLRRHHFSRRANAAHSRGRDQTGSLDSPRRRPPLERLRGHGTGSARLGGSGRFSLGLPIQGDGMPGGFADCGDKGIH